jgi:GNAT superfamily N-acetyltransferase
VQVRIEQASESDVEAIARLLGEIEHYYGGDYTPGNADEIRDALFGERPAATCLIARDGDSVLGMASYSYLWPAAGSTKSLYLKELYVRADARSQGVGQKFMAELQRIAEAAGCSRIEWTGDTDNPLALAFYAKMGVPRNDGKVFYRLPLQRG